MTGGRLRRVRDYLDDEAFCFTYGDAVSDVDLAAVIDHHRKAGRLATVTAVQPPGRWGVLQMTEAGTVSGFEEKPPGDNADSLINGGFFVLEPRVLDYIEADETHWEAEPMERLAAEDELAAYHHRGFWQAMDTIRDRNHLEALWAEGHAPWKTW
jgi:glucose-1-phosphate cytidylyltransferase